MVDSPKGTHDLLPNELVTWQFVEAKARAIMESARYQEIRTPIFESTQLFERGVGESTDIVNKEMYSFQKGERSLTLRPEGTAGVVRAYIQHGMDRWPKPVKLYYFGPMFRYERPQKGRQRQFHQIGVESFGLDTSQADAEVIQLAMIFFQELGLQNLNLEINNVGCLECRAGLRDQLREKLAPFLGKLCPDCNRRYEQNPLRMLDCKVPEDQALYKAEQAMELLGGDNTCEPCQTHFNDLIVILDGLSIPYHRNPMLVRGLDYYTRTVFEITSGELGAQSAVCGGGRYNGLVKELGGPDTPATGWALGMERLVSLVKPAEPKPLQFYVISDDPVTALQTAANIRDLGYCVEADLSGKKNFGKMLTQANRLGAQFVVMLGPDERAADQVTWKNLGSGHQETVSTEGFKQFLLSMQDDTTSLDPMVLELLD